MLALSSKSPKRELPDTEKCLSPQNTGRTLNTSFFSQAFRAVTGISQQKSRDIPPKNLVSLGFEGTYRTFCPHPFTWKALTPPEDIRTNRLGLGSFFVPDFVPDPKVLPGLQYMCRSSSQAQPSQG